ncbi:MAG: hypothetical protein ACYC26_14515 [Phycisphaerales bacterium]
MTETPTLTRIVDEVNDTRLFNQPLAASRRRLLECVMQSVA